MMTPMTVTTGQPRLSQRRSCRVRLRVDFPLVIVLPTVESPYSWYSNRSRGIVPNASEFGVSPLARRRVYRGCYLMTFSMAPRRKNHRWPFEDGKVWARDVG